MSLNMEIHRDDLASKTGMWLFLFTEMLLFGGLFVVYSVYRYRNAEAFHLAAHELKYSYWYCKYHHPLDQQCHNSNVNHCHSEEK